MNLWERRKGTLQAINEEIEKNIRTTHAKIQLCTHKTTGSLKAIAQAGFTYWTTYFLESRYFLEN